MKKLLCAFITCVLIFCTGCTSESPEEMCITIFDAGKADAILIETEKGSVLIDTGLEENKDELLSELEERNIGSLYALIITHFDKDHVGGADWIVSKLDVKHVYTSSKTKESEDITSFEEALKQAGLSASVIRDTQTFTLAGITFEMNGTDTEFEKNESNNSSLIVKVSFGKKTYLFMGDAQNERIEEYLEENDADADFLKIPYHGHYQKKLDELLAEVTPEVSVITNSDAEPEEDELEKTMRVLEEAGTQVYQTAYGTVTLVCDPESFRIGQ